MSWFTTTSFLDLSHKLLIISINYSMKHDITPYLRNGPMMHLEMRRFSEPNLGTFWRSCLGPRPLTVLVHCRWPSQQWPRGTYTRYSTSSSDPSCKCMSPPCTKEKPNTPFFIFSFLFGKSPYYHPRFLRKSVFPPWTLKPGKTPPTTFKIIHLTSLALL
jgi:hypothetical protein